MQKYFRFLFGLRTFLKNRIPPDEAIELANKALQQRVSDRERNFLNLVEKGIFGYPKSPYLSLLLARKIDFSDVKQWVEKDGLESTLVKLQGEGVYFTVDEYKGKSDVTRNGFRIRLREQAFDNPFHAAAYEVRSGATRSAGTRIRIDFD